MLIWRAGMTQGAVAEEVGMEPTALGKKLRGKNGWAVQELIDLAAVLGTTVGFLVGESEESPSPTGAAKEPTSDYKAIDSVAVVSNLAEFRAAKAAS